MDGWLFAVAALVAILGIELAIFRYFADDRPVGNAAPTGTGHGRADSPETSESEQSAAFCQCNGCGMLNRDVGTFLYCRRCLARIH